MTETDLTFVDETLERIGRKREHVIAILQAIQVHYRYLPEEALRKVCDDSEITPADITGVSTFYNQFRHHPVGKHIVKVCHGTACHIKGAGRITDALRTHLNIPDDDDTDPDGLFTLEKIACLGCCTLAPVVQIDDVVYGHLKPDTVAKMLTDFLDLQKRGGGTPRRELGSAEGAGQAEVRVGLGSCCIARGSGKVREELVRALEDVGADASVKRVGCVGMCHQTPLVEIVKPDQPSALYAEVQPEDVRAIIQRHFRPRSLIKRAELAVSRGLDKLLTDEAWPSVSRHAIHTRDKPIVEFLGRQKHLATEHCGVIDPLDIEEHRRRGGFVALQGALGGTSPEQIIEQVQASGLRGRGGAGFPTGIKWSRVRAAAGADKYIVCNCDEGDPGAFMDRMLLESYPFRVIEGIILAAYAVGASRGYFYIRAEYPLAVHRIREALGVCREQGYLGEGILGSGFSLDLRIMEGAGAFVCGEETALLASIEGRRGMPRFRPPYPSDRGLWGKPTLVNNVETYSLLPWILTHGAEAFAEMGTETSKGTKVFALAGKIARGGLIEVPMGVTLRQIVEEIGGGIAEGKRFKAVQIGGPSGGCVPAEMADIPVDYEALTAAGAIMGSGGLVVLDEDDCMVDIARYFLEFTQDQSCGKCTFCRIGTRRMLEVLERLCGGEGQEGDIELLQQLAAQIKAGSLCALGGTAPNPVLSTIEHFRDEYEAHIAGRCPAGRCTALVTYSVTDDCVGCTLCAQHCPVGAIEMTPYETHEIDPEICVRCGTCKTVCPADAIRIE